MLPPGRLRLAVRPSCTGSPSVANTMGTVEVAALAASAPGVVVAARHAQRTVNIGGQQKARQPAGFTGKAARGRRAGGLGAGREARRGLGSAVPRAFPKNTPPPASWVRRNCRSRERVARGTERDSHHARRRLGHQPPAPMAWYSAAGTRASGATTLQSGAGRAEHRRNNRLGNGPRGDRPRAIAILDP